MPPTLYGRDLDRIRAVHAVRDPAVRLRLDAIACGASPLSVRSERTGAGGLPSRPARSVPARRAARSCREALARAGDRVRDALLLLSAAVS